jgi:hypothetical protein
VGKDVSIVIARPFGEGSNMRRFVLVPVLLALVLFAAPAAASSTLNFSATFNEPTGGPVHSPFSCPPGEGCGSGEVVGVGQATETIVFNGCGQLCDIRTISFATGSTLVLFERPSNFQIPGQSYHAPGHAFGHPFSVTLSDTVDGADSTGMFAGSSGTLTGEAKVAGGMAIITLSGPIALA